jgi:TetR/AcrR family transcriptional regulator, transcriptional repressor of aconitase
MPRVSQQHRDARRDQILDAARRCFLRDGFHATSMPDLFTEAGLSAGAVYRYFASKDDVILAIAEDNLREVLAMINQVATADPGRSAGEVVAAALALVQAKDEADGVSGMAVLVWSEALRNPGLAGKLRALLASLHDDFTRLVADHQRAGDLPGEVPADAVARTLVAIMAGYILQLAILGPDAVSVIPDAIQALWPPGSAR